MIHLDVTTFQVQVDGAFCALICGIALVWLVVGIFVYRDAESRGMNGIGWFFLVFFLGLIGILIYVLVRKDRPVPYSPPPTWADSPMFQYRPPVPPPSTPASPASPASPAAGPTEQVRSCASCGAALPLNASFCPNCGTRVM